MPLRPILRPSREGLRLLLAGLVAGSATLSPAPGGERDTAQLIVRYQVARADGPGDWPFLWKGWPMFRHDQAGAEGGRTRQAPMPEKFDQLSSD